MAKRQERSTAKDVWTDLHRIADEAEPEVKKAFLDAVVQLQDGIPLQKVRQAYAKGDITEAIRLVEGVFDQISEELQIQIRNIQRGVLQDAGQLAATRLSDDILKNVSITFDGAHPQVLELIRRQGAEILTELDANTRKGIREIFAQSMEGRFSPRRFAEELEGLVGLTPKQVKAVENYRKFLDTLEVGVPVRDMEIGNAERRRLMRGGLRGFSQALSAAKKEDLAKKYADRLLRERAEGLAQTVTLDAVASGQDLMWRQAVERGLLEESEWEVFWVVTPDDRLCPICRPMHGETRKINGVYARKAGDGSTVARPILHFRCRCVESMEPTEEFRDALGPGPMLDELQSAVPGEQPFDADRIRELAKKAKTESQIREVGALLRQEIYRRLGKGTNEARETLLDLRKAMLRANLDEETTAAFKKSINKAYLDLENLDELTRKLRPEKVIEVLQELRALDQFKLTIHGDAQVAKLLQKASRKIPRTWLQVSDDWGPLQVERLTGKGRRLTGKGRVLGEHQVTPGFGSTIRLRLMDESTALHEFSHRLQAINPEIRTMEDAWLRRRLQQEKRKPFVDTYVKTRNQRHNAVEVFSTGMEGLFGNQKFSGWDGRDHDHMDLILGILVRD